MCRRASPLERCVSSFVVSICRTKARVGPVREKEEGFPREGRWLGRDYADGIGHIGPPSGPNSFPMRRLAIGLAIDANANYHQYYAKPRSIIKSPRCGHRI